MNRSSNRFDKVLREVGEFGLYQKRLLFLMTITSGCVFMQNLSPVFTMKTPPHRCRIPGLVNDTYEIQNSQHAFLVNWTIPRDEKGDYSQCSVYDVSGGYDVIGGDNVTGRYDVIVDNRTEVTCDDWVFDRSVFKSTYVTELKLVCDNKQYRSHSTMMVFIGKFLGAFSNSVLGDYVGRRRVYLVMMLAMTTTSVCLIFVSSLPMLMALRFLAGATTTGSFLPTYVITIELVGTSYRRGVGIAKKVVALSTDLLVVLCSFLTRDWRYFQACLAVPCVFVLIGYFFLPESPRWLVSKGRLSEAQQVVEHVAKTNGVTQAPRLESEAFGTGDNSQGDKGRVYPYQLFRVPRLLLRFALLYCSWILVMMCIYGLELNVTNMSGDLFVNFSLMAVMDVLALLLFALLVERMGRRLFLLVTTAVGGLACLSTILPTLLGGSDWILRVLSFTGKMCVSAALSAIYIMSPELFPTVLRSFGVGSCSMVSRFGGIASPYVADLNTFVGGQWGTALPQIVFGAAGITTSFMVFFLPETRGRHLPETIQDTIRFGRSDQQDNVRPSHEIAVMPLVGQEEAPAAPAANDNTK